MRIAWWRAAIVFLAGGLPGSLVGEGVLDHVAELYLDTPVDWVWVIRADMDGDGKEEWFVTSLGMPHGLDGVMWQAFREGRDGLRWIGDATFPREAAVGESEAGWGIHSFFDAGSGWKSITRHHLIGGIMRSEVIDDETEDVEMWESFMERGKLTVEQISRDELYERYPVLAKVIPREEGGVSGAGEVRRNEVPVGSRRGDSHAGEEEGLKDKARGNRWPLWAALGALVLSLGYGWAKRRS